VSESTASTSLQHPRGQATGGGGNGHSSVNGWSAEYLEAQYQRFLEDPLSVPEDTRSFFQGFDLALGGGAFPKAGLAGQASADEPLDYRVSDLVEAYRARGHLAARIDPLRRERGSREQLQPAYHGIGDHELSRRVRTPLGETTVAELNAFLESRYCGPVGAEFMHIPSEHIRGWFIERIERADGGGFRAEDERSKRTILKHLFAAECFDRFLGKRYPGKKRFSLEGGESLIPLLKAMTQRAGELGTEEIILGMAHRGRLSVLRNYLGKDLDKLFTEFEDSWSDAGRQGGGDVKYHRGYSGDQPVEGTGRSVHLSMLNNPSHLEAVNALVMGRCRAKQDSAHDTERRRIVSVLLHGDAAVIGQGVVAECLNMSQLDGYRVGGTIHIVTNNMVGFTTDASDARSTPYCTDVAKIVNAPVLHVNADDPEAVVWAAKVAADFRHEFRRDVFIDLVCFRKYGHNEQDEPGYTQPQLTALIKEHPGAPANYRARLVGEGVVTEEEVEAVIEGEIAELDAAQSAVQQGKKVNPVVPPGSGAWTGMEGAYSFDAPPTAVEPGVVARVCAAMGAVPEQFQTHAKLKGLLDARRNLPATGRISHADAEQLAIGTLLLQGVPVRLSGQDCRRGTFTQRHAVLRDVETGERYTPLNHISEGEQAELSVWDSPLSEYAVMGFDYGYSRGSPRTLVMWEAQFGDFVNGAQIVLDQFLASSEVKWSRWAGLVLLLPHGYEGQGPEHSAARLERFLQLCANENMEVVYPTTGPQMFHVLRRQALRNFRKPLVVMTPKKFLRVETGSMSELSTGSFRHVFDDPMFTDARSAGGVSRVVYCSGKIYHELHEKRLARGVKDVAIVRIEQLYPFHTEMARAVDSRYPKSAQRVWVQEDPRNYGAYLSLADVFREQLGIDLSGDRYIGRAACPSPATGSEHAHKDEQEAILAAALRLGTSGGGHGG
jgi:2-oxoglutarate dehydrogenase E1 component